MSQRPIARSADLNRLRNDGYSIRIVGGYLVADDVPFVDSEGVVHHDGALVLPLTLAGDITAPPTDHTARFMGGVPRDAGGQPLAHIINHANEEDLGDGLRTSCYFSAKPTDGGQYTDLHHKVTTYIGHIAGPAHLVDPTTTARRYTPSASEDETGRPFKYVDTASSRAGIAVLNELLKGERVGIVGLGGTGEYLLDAVTKTHVEEIHIFDGDAFLTHNAFRAPGAPTLDQLTARPLKVDHFGDIYDNMRQGIIRHPYPVDQEHLHELAQMTFVFVAIDDAEAKRPIIDTLVHGSIPFIDVGMGVEVVDGRLVGTIRTTVVTPDHNGHADQRIPTTIVPVENDDYRSNIQIAELNMLNAAQAVIAWKKYRRYYADMDRPHHMMYSIASNKTVNDERIAPPSADEEADAA
ncbi:MAG: ThiF family adenylyltransferase [Acidimicrobiia bacterium]